MLTILKSVQTMGADYIEGFALSTDTLPTNVANGSKVEVLTIDDSGDDPVGTIAEHRFDAASAAWIPITTAAAAASDAEEET